MNSKSIAAPAWSARGFGRYQPETSHLLQRLGLAGRLYSRIVGFTDVGSYGRFLWFREALRRVDIEPRRVLDAGCGTGEYAFWMAEHLPDARITGLEYNPARVGQCERVRTKFALRNVEFHQADLTKLQEEHHPWDLIYSVDVLEHIEGNRDVIRRLGNALAPGGYLLIRIPAAYQRRILPQRMFRALEAWAEEEHVGQHFELESLCEYLESVGLDVIYRAKSSGMWGRLGFELSYVLEQNARVLHALLIPALKAFYWLDVAGGPKDDGNGVVVLARRPTARG